MTPIRPSPDWYPSRPPPPVPGPPRRLLHLGVLFVSLFVLVRTVLLEPFGVPTGSMAPALLGIHRSQDCSRCGYPILVGEPAPDGRPVAWDRCRCPNCGLGADLSDARVLPGDRLLVDKTAYLHRPPRRWEVAVFDCPADRSKPYVKRLVGLPGEFIQVSDGDVYANGQLLRKTLAEVREVMVPVFDLAYAPEGGWGRRWLLDNAELRGDELVLDGRTKPATATYRHLNLDTDREEPVDGWLGYNGGPAERRGSFGKLNRGDCAHDFVVIFDLEVTPGDSGTVECRLGDGADEVTAAIGVGGDGDSYNSAELRRVGEMRLVENPGKRSYAECERIGYGRRHRVEVAFVDRRVSMAVNGLEVAPAHDVPADRPGSARRQGVARLLALTATASVVVRNLRLFRDVHYLPFGAAASGVQLGPAEYFALGDNTANSHDSRTWHRDGKPAPGVPAGGLVGKPFLVHQPLRLSRLPGVGPVQTLDWDRLRLLR